MSQGFSPPPKKQMPPEELALAVVKSGKMVHILELGISTELVHVFLFPAKMMSDQPTDDLVEIVNGLKNKGIKLAEVTVAQTTGMTYVFVNQRRRCRLTEAEQMAIVGKGMARMLDYKFKKTLYAFAGTGMQALSPDLEFTACSVEKMKRLIGKRTRRDRMVGFSETFVFYRPSGAIACIL